MLSGAVKDLQWSPDSLVRCLRFAQFYIYIYMYIYTYIWMCICIYMNDLQWSRTLRSTVLHISCENTYNLQTWFRRPYLRRVVMLVETKSISLPMSKRVVTDLQWSLDSQVRSLKEICPQVLCWKEICTQVRCLTEICSQVRCLKEICSQVRG